MEMIVIWAAVAFLAAGFAAFLCSQKNRDHSSWMAWSFVLPPAVLVLLLLPKRTGPPPRRPSLDDEDRRGAFFD